MLVPLVGEAAASLRRRRRKPDGWVPVHLGLVARTKTDGRTHWLEGEHASHWAWPDVHIALQRMRPLKARGTTTLVLLLWSPVWAGDFVEVGPPEHHDAFIRSLCWLLMPEDVPDSWARAGNPVRRGLAWRHDRPGEIEQLPV